MVPKSKNPVLFMPFMLKALVSGFIRVAA